MDRLTADTLVVMARQPVPGTVKTRLARRIGAAPAAALYAAFLADIAVRLAHPSWRLLWAVTPGDADLSPLVGASAAHLPQRGADLAARMANVFADLFDRGAGRVVMIGADAPHLGCDSIAAAFAALASADVVLLPTRDGGYCLVGQAAPHDLFRGVDMGTPAVWAQTQARVAALRLSAATLPASFDIDEWDDLVALRQQIESGAVHLPRTAAALAGLPR